MVQFASVSIMTANNFCISSDYIRHSPRSSKKREEKKKRNDENYYTN